MELILMYISRFSVLIPLFFVLAGENRFKIKTLNLLGGLLLVSGLTDMSTYIMGARQINTAFVSNLYTLLEFSLLCLIFINLLSTQKRLIYTLMGIFFAFFLLNSLQIQKLTEFQGYALTLEGVFLLILSILYFIKHVKLINTPIPISPEISEQNLRESTKLYESIFNPTNHLNLWINSAVFFYFVMDIYLFCMSSYVFKNESEDLAMTFWSFHNVSNIVKNGMFATGIYYAGIKTVRLSH